MTDPRPLVLVPSRTELARLEPLPGLELVPCGVGVVEAALGTQAVLDRCRPARVVLAGLAGSRDLTRAPLGACVCPVAVVNEAVGAGAGADFVALDAMGLPGEDCASERLALEPLPRLGEGVHLGGVAATVAAASGSPDQAAAWRARHPDALLEEMEGWAVARVCAARDVPVSMLRAVSNVCGDRDWAGWDLDRAFRSLRVALVALSETVA